MNYTIAEHLLILFTATGTAVWILATALFIIFLIGKLTK